MTQCDVMVLRAQRVKQYFLALCDFFRESYQIVLR